MDLTILMDKYKECARNIWNTYFYGQDIKRDVWDVSDDFDKICGILFSNIVFNTIGNDFIRKANTYEQFPSPIMTIKIVPCSKEDTSIMINRDIRSSGYWDHKIGKIKASEVDLRFIDYFDFNLQGIRSFEFYRVRIVDGLDKLDITGRDALIKTSHARVELLSNSSAVAPHTTHVTTNNSR